METDLWKNINFMKSILLFRSILKDENSLNQIFWTENKTEKESPALKKFLFHIS